MDGNSLKHGDYRPRIAALLSLYEDNYQRLQRLVPKLGILVGSVEAVGEHGAATRLEIVERFPYTSTICLSQELPAGAGLRVDIRMCVRLYHDAKLAEVVSYQGEQRFEPRYAYPNRRMRQQDEKQQVNCLLAEWLEHCLARGCAFTDAEAVA